MSPASPAARSTAIPPPTSDRLAAGQVVQAVEPRRDAVEVPDVAAPPVPPPLPEVLRRVADNLEHTVVVVDGDDAAVRLRLPAVRGEQGASIWGRSDGPTA